MEFDIYAKSADLLERLSNSIYDRHPNYPVGFGTPELHIVENWLKDVIRDLSNSPSLEQPGED